MLYQVHHGFSLSSDWNGIVLVGSSSHFISSVIKSFSTSRKLCFAMDFRAIKIKSTLRRSSFLCNRKHSLISLLARLRITAFPKRLLVTTPSLENEAVGKICQFANRQPLAKRSPFSLWFRKSELA